MVSGQVLKVDLLSNTYLNDIVQALQLIVHGLVWFAVCDLPAANEGF